MDDVVEIEKSGVLLTPEAIITSNSNSNDIYNQIPSAQSRDNIASIVYQDCQSNLSLFHIFKL